MNACSKVSELLFGIFMVSWYSLFPFIFLYIIFTILPLILMTIVSKYTFKLQKAEGYFRFSLARLKEYSGIYFF
jgi:ABC-type uncharacterized transport system fused permease/ATPase subunit